MKQSNSRGRNCPQKYREETAALYVRLSRDDNLDGDSYSIQNQKKILIKAAKDKGYSKYIVYADDGISGVTMERPGFKQMIRDIEDGKITAVFVKDMSRLGRNYVKVGYYTEELFPEYDVRLVAISDGVDSNEGENEFVPFKNIMNEHYARDISKKCRIVNKMKGESGIPLGQPPYGYMKDPDDSKRWIIDEEAAITVRRIYKMYLDGVSYDRIAETLDNDGILTPLNYIKSKGKNRGGVQTAPTPTYWRGSSVRKILSMQEYCGDVINFKTYSKSFKHKKRMENAEENRAVFKDIHKPVIERPTWEIVQEKRESAKKRPPKTGEKSMFSELLICADCGGNMNYHFNQKNHDIKYFNCHNNNNGRKRCDKTHYIREGFLEQVVLQEIRRLTKFASHYEAEFAEIIMGHSKNVSETDRKIKQKELTKLTARDKELDGIYQGLFEANLAGKLTDERFEKMRANYDFEQNEIDAKIKKLRSEFSKAEEKALNADNFISTVRKYTRVKKLTAYMLSELIERIEVFHAEVVDGVKTQRLNIHYNCVGVIDIPDDVPIDLPDVTLNTRKGVSLCYAV